MNKQDYHYHYLIAALFIISAVCHVLSLVIRNVK